MQFLRIFFFKPISGCTATSAVQKPLHLHPILFASNLFQLEYYIAEYFSFQVWPQSGKHFFSAKLKVQVPPIATVPVTMVLKSLVPVPPQVQLQTQCKRQHFLPLAKGGNCENTNRKLSAVHLLPTFSITPCSNWVYVVYEYRFLLLASYSKAKRRKFCLCPHNQIVETYPNVNQN